MLRDALTRALTPTTTMSSHTYYSPTPTPNPTPQFVTPHMTTPQFSLPAPPSQSSAPSGLPSPTSTIAPPQFLVADSSSAGDSCGAQRLCPSPSPQPGPRPVQCHKPTAQRNLAHRLPSEPAEVSCTGPCRSHPPQQRLSLPLLRTSSFAHQMSLTECTLTCTPSCRCSWCTQRS